MTTQASTDHATRAEYVARLNTHLAALRAKQAAITPEEARSYDGRPLPRYPRTTDERHRVLLRWPRITAHLICSSLGYFSPCAAANAITAYRNGHPCYCEWYTTMAASYDADKLVRVGKDTLQHAIRTRHQHQGFMAEYVQARIVILEELSWHGPELASWF